MKTLLLTLLLLAPAFAQYDPAPWFVKNESGRIGVSPLLRAEPSFTGWEGRFRDYARGRSISNGPTFFTRILIDRDKRIYFGYELLVEQQKPGVYLATFGPLGVTPLDLAAGTLPKSSPGNATNWTLQPLPQLPSPRIVKDGEVFTIELFTEIETGSKLFEDIMVNPPGTHVPGSKPTPVVRTGPVEGPARDFTLADAETHHRPAAPFRQQAADHRRSAAPRHPKPPGLALSAPPRPLHPVPDRAPQFQKSRRNPRPVHDLQTGRRHHQARLRQLHRPRGFRLQPLHPARRILGAGLHPAKRRPPHGHRKCRRAKVAHAEKQDALSAALPPLLIE